MRLLILPDPANVFAPSDNAILLPLLLPEAPIGILPTTSPPARSTAEVDMSAFDENMDPSSSSLSSSLKRGRNSPAKGPIVGTKVRILPLGVRVFLLFSMGVLEAFFYRAYSGGYLFFFLAPFDARPGPWLYLARVQLMGAHPHQQPATAGHTSTKTPAEIRKAMAVGLAVIAAGGHERRFFSGPPFTGGAWGTGGRSGLAHVAVLARKCHTRGALPAVVEVTI